MRINHNIAALNTHRQLTGNTAQASKSLEKLSSGFRINRAGDDAAGLAISEKMRAQIRGLDMAAKNSQDGISLIQTAEGALNETHSILQRMRELADQSANGTNTAEDRKNLQDEIVQLKAEVDRIGNTTEFNTQKLLNGNLNGAGGTAGTDSLSGAAIFKSTKGNLVGADASGIDTSAAGAIDYTKTDALIVDGKKIDIQWNKYLTDEDKGKLQKDWATGTAMSEDETNAIAKILEKAINSAIDDSGTGVEHIKVLREADGQFKFESGTRGSNSRVELYVGDDGTARLADGSVAEGTASVLDFFGGAEVEMVGVATSTHGQYQTLEAVTNGTDKFRVVINGHAMEVDPTTVNAGSEVKDLAASLQTDINAKIDAYNAAAGYTTDDTKIKHVEIQERNGRLVITSPSGPVELEEVSAAGTTLEKIGMDSTARESAGNGAMTFQIGANKGQTISFNIGDMRTSALGISGLDISSKQGASEALTKLDNAIKKVSSERSKMGAVQNRLEHTINNLQTASENLTAAESRIRDVDMAKEMMDFTKNNILSQAAQAMLAQANQQPQGVLQLLR
ncbi:flagellin N-terminal helical domain-containing protein [Paenibacillus puerhi]|uniref:flagellin N-terminal helical domain-containing protein n=1 Tax=Paenibacillus puerhi TaxID=2692622 RepID=UPI001357CE2A|nr:flagellin [Paenibacillus puerhi]